MSHENVSYRAIRERGKGQKRERESAGQEQVCVGRRRDRHDGEREGKKNLFVTPF